MSEQPPGERRPDVPSGAFIPPAYTIADAYAIKALADGTAEPEQQKRALEWIVEHAACKDELSFRPVDDGGRNTAFGEGRRFVGLQIVKLLRMPRELLKT